jgi:hypothetical protein
MRATITLPGKIVDPEFARYTDYDIEVAQFGQGQWPAFRALNISLDELMSVASEWGRKIEFVDRPWLCWNVNDDWCLVQQKLVTEAGWTPLVGFDPRVGPPTRILPNSVVFDFNKNLGLPILYPHFPLEFAFLFCERIAFWHSDLLIRRQKMRALAGMFEQLSDGQTAATWVAPGLRYSFSESHKRYWELVGCTTRRASRDQFEKGCGWWMAYWGHPNQQHGGRIKTRYYWDHGAGIYYWHKHAYGDVVVMPGSDYAEGHFTKIGNKAYVRTVELGGTDVRRKMSEEIVRHFDIREACAKLDLTDILNGAGA